MNNQETGKLGENLATKYLQERGYKVIERNFWKPWGELDVVALAPDKTLVFVEVKTLNNDLTEASSSDVIQPEENLTKAKLKKLQRTARIYANSHLELVNDDRGWRIDLIAINMFTDKNGKERFDIRHYENI